jgi:uncharacterized protein (TIGR03067 family)
VNMEPPLSGSWVPVAADVSGQALDIKELRVARLSFDPERYAIVDHAGQIVDAGTWQLGALGNPWSIDLLGNVGPNAGRRLLAIMALDGDRLCLGYDMERDQRPGGWRSEPEQLLLSITLVRQGTGEVASAPP